MIKRGIFVFGIVFFIIVLGLGFVIADVFQDKTQVNFNGTYVNTSYNGNGIILSTGNLTGTYTSRIFDAGGIVRWNNISFEKNLSDIGYLFAVDNSAGIWKSSDSGVTWINSSSDYNPGLGNLGAVNIVSNISGSLFVANAQDLWGADDKGVTWRLINDDTNGAGDSNDAVAMAMDGNVIYIIDASEDVLKSTNSGINFTKVNNTDFNNGNGAVKAMIVNSSGVIFAVDAQSDVWKSTNSGVSWSLVYDDYNGGNGNGATDMAVNGSGALFILDNQDLWQSTNSGVSWVLINDDFNNGADSGNGQAIDIDLNNYIYIADGSEDIYKSVNSGINFTRIVENFNGANGLIKGLTFVLSSTNLTFQVKNCSLSECSDGIFANLNLNNINLTGRYFQYKSYFSSQDSSITPKLYNVSIGYTILDNISPLINIISPLNRNYTTSSILVNISASDENLESVWFYDGVVNTSYTGAVYHSFSQGNNNLTAYARDYFGNVNSSSVSFFIDSVNPLVNVIIPQEGASYGFNTTIALNFSAYDLNGINRCWYNINNGNNQSISNCLNTSFRIAANGTYLVNLFANDSFGLVANDSVSFNVINSAPLINIISPQNGTTYGYNQSIALYFSVSDIDNNLDKCWYNINNGNNKSLVNCQNTSFNVSGNGNYVLKIFANDSLGLVSSNSVNFEVQVGAPTIVLNSPIDVYLNYKNISFSYIPSDIDLRSCELWGNFDGEFKLNQTNNNPVNGTANIFYLNLSDRVYVWNIRCNDSQGHFAFNGNKTFYIDTNAPVISITEPVGKKTSRTNIPFSFSIIENNTDSCWYNVYRGVSIEIQNTSVNCISSSSLNVTVDADFVLNLYANDSAGNSNSASSSFSVDTSTPVTPPSGGGSSGGGGGGSITNLNKTTIPGKLEVSRIGDIISQAGDKKTLSLNVKNTGKMFLNNCRLIGKGEISSWVYSRQIQGIAPGEKIDFIFDLNVPEGTVGGDYLGNIEIDCDEMKNSQILKITIPRGLQLIQIKEIKQEKNALNISYLFDGSKTNEKEINIEIWLVDRDNIDVKRVTDSFVNEKTLVEKNIIIQLPSGLIGGLYLVYFALSSDLSNFVTQSVVLGKTSATGFTILDEPRNKMIAYVIFILIIALGVSFIIWRRSDNIKGLKHREKVRYPYKA